ncbi:LysR family transcriptional regulator (plasmid) [Ensifer adhaerens]
MHSHHRIDWEDLRFVLAVAEANSLAAAARALGVNHTTVLRRVGSFEQKLGVRLFDRLPSGYMLTAGGEELLAVARQMAETVTELERRLTGQDLRLEGSLRITTTDTLMASILPSILADFRQRHPGVLLEVSTSNALANLSHRDADVAIRPAVDSPDALVGRRIAKVAFAVYAAPSYLDVRELTADTLDIAREHWIGLGDALASTSVARWMRATLVAPAVLRCDLAGYGPRGGNGRHRSCGPALLSRRHDARSHPHRRTGRRYDEELWLLTHEDLRRTARVSAFTEFVGQALAKHRPLLEGNKPST